MHTEGGAGVGTGQHNYVCVCVWVIMSLIPGSHPSSYATAYMVVRASDTDQMYRVMNQDVP